VTGRAFCLLKPAVAVPKDFLLGNLAEPGVILEKVSYSEAECVRMRVFTSVNVL